MASFNQCTFIGNCADNPEVRVFTDGGKIATIRIAVSERYQDRQGQQKENTEWISIVFNGKLADFAEKYVTKGASVFVSGKYHTRSWQDQSGAKHYATDIVASTIQLLDRRNQDQSRQPAQAPAPAPQYQQPVAPAPAPAPAPQPQYQQPAPGYAPQPQYGQAPAPAAPPQYQPVAQPAQPQYQPAGSSDDLSF